MMCLTRDANLSPDEIQSRNNRYKSAKYRQRFAQYKKQKKTDDEIFESKNMNVKSKYATDYKD